jgi:hypothetical protein
VMSTKKHLSPCFERSCPQGHQSILIFNSGITCPIAGRHTTAADMDVNSAFIDLSSFADVLSDEVSANLFRFL